MPSVTLTFSAEHASRIQSALELGYPVLDEEGNLIPADVEQFKDFLRSHTVKFVRNVERQQARDAADGTVTFVDLT